MPYSSFDTEIGTFTVRVENGCVTGLWLPYRKKKPPVSDFLETETSKEAARQIKQYFKGSRKVFDLPLDPGGTDFMGKVWKEVLKIPYGRVSTYKEIAERICHPKAFRAVGLANGKNPIPILIPCHRVIGSNGSLTGYGGGMEMKSRLLLHEGADLG